MCYLPRCSSCLLLLRGACIFFTEPRDESHAIDRQHCKRDRVRGDDEIPSSGNHSSGHTASPISFSSSAGGGASSFLRRSDETRARSRMNAVIRKRIPKAL